MSDIGAVVIGRNEAHNLPRCLTSVVGHVSAVVFVDSGSTDGSTEVARRFGVDIVELDRSAPFTVARARNAGFEHLVRCHPALRFVQFVDGDSEMIPSWFAAGRAALLADPGRAAAFGRWRERQSRRSIYARVYQIESAPQFCSPPRLPGMAMMRIAAFEQAGGFNSTLQALEDHELNLRLSRADWQVARIDTEMAVHEAGIDSWQPWWRRRVRGGYGVAQGLWLHGGSPERFLVRRSLSIWGWGVVLPVAIVGGIAAFGSSALVLLLAYPVLAAFIFRRLRRLGFERDDAGAYALLACLAKFPEAIGHARFYLLGRPRA